jgi:hemolysin activation/secretion protein
MAWEVPLTSRDLTLELRYDYNGSVVLDDIYKGLDIISLTQTAHIGLFAPVLQDYEISDGVERLEDVVKVGLAFEYRESKSYLLDMPFSFSPGEVQGVAHVGVFRFTSDWTERDGKSVVVAKSTFSFGLPGLNGPPAPQQPGGSFVSWLGQVRYVRDVMTDWQLVVRGDIQLADSPLFPFEQIGVGGASTVRGYRENQLVTDDAVVSSVELREPILGLQLPAITDSGPGGELSAAYFVDFGDAWNVGRPTFGPQNIGSYGVGLRWDAPGSGVASLYYGRGWRPFHMAGHDLQDSGIHFSVSKTF